MSAHRGKLVALKRPPGCGAAIGIMVSGFDGSPGALGLMDATSKAGAAGVWAPRRKPAIRKRAIAALTARVRFTIVSLSKNGG
jgi:hypothetical protein